MNTFYFWHRQKKTVQTVQGRYGSFPTQKRYQRMFAYSPSAYSPEGHGKFAGVIKRGRWQHIDVATLPAAFKTWLLVAGVL